MSAGDRFERVCKRLRELGVGYRGAYGGAFESRWPHSSHVLAIVPDRRGTEVRVVDAAGDGDYEVIGKDDDPDSLAEEIVCALESALWKIEQLTEDD